MHFQVFQKGGVTVKGLNDWNIKLAVLCKRCRVVSVWESLLNSLLLSKSSEDVSRSIISSSLQKTFFSSDFICSSLAPCEVRWKIAMPGDKKRFFGIIFLVIFKTYFEGKLFAPRLTVYKSVLFLSCECVCVWKICARDIDLQLFSLCIRCREALWEMCLKSQSQLQTKRPFERISVGS